jgi:hypothetical protein
MSATKMVLFGPAVLYTMSLAIAKSSHVLQTIQVVEWKKLFTAAAISFTFVGLSYALPGIATAFAKLGPLGVAKLVLFGPTVFAALANAISDSSIKFQDIKPVGFLKLFTAVLISIAFAAIGYGLEKIISAFSRMKIDPGRAALIGIMMPIIFVALAYAVAGASTAFTKVEIVSFLKMFTAIIIAIAFIPLAYAAAAIGMAMSKITIKQALLMPVILVLLATAVMLSSFIFAQTKIIPWETLWNVFLQTISLAAIGIVLGATIYVINMMGLKISDAIKGSLILLVLATTLMISSLILGLGTYGNYPSWKWAIGVGLSILFFAPAVVLLGLVAMADGGLSQLLGAVMVLVLALAITGVSHILSMGKYDAYPPIQWTASVVLLMIPFAILSVALGAIALTGIGAVAFALGIPMMFGIANTIVEVSKILKKGDYNLPGILPWTFSIVLLYSTFVPILLLLGGVALMNAVISVFGPDPWKMARKMIVQIAQTIVEVAAVFRGGNFTGGPTMEWANGVAIAIGAFAPVYGMLLADNLMKKITGGGIGPKEFSQAITTVVNGIVTAAAELYKAGDAFRGGPPKEWAESVGAAIGAFAPVYGMLINSAIFKEAAIGPKEFAQAIMVVCTGIVDAAKFFGSDDNKGVFDLTKIPSKSWGEAVGGAINAIMPALEFISKNADWWSGVDVTIVSKAIDATSRGIRDSSIILKNGDYEGGVKKEWVIRTGDAIKAYVDFVFWLYKNDGLNTRKDYFLKVSKTIVETANILASGDYKNSITKEWINTISDATSKYVDLVFWVYSKDGLNDAMGYFPKVSNSMIRLASDYAMVAKNAKKLNPDWLKNVFQNIIFYIKIAQWLSKRKVRFSGINDTVWGLWKLSSGYSELAKAVQKLNKELDELDVDKLNALKSFNSSVVLLSLMDPEQFSDMMKELEDKGGYLFKAIEELKNEEKNKPQKPGNTAEVSGNKPGGGGSSPEERLATAVDELKTAISGVVTNTGNIESFLRTNFIKDPLRPPG